MGVTVASVELVIYGGSQAQIRSAAVEFFTRLFGTEGRNWDFAKAEEKVIRLKSDDRIRPVWEGIYETQSTPNGGEVIAA